jgi:hypothetical protein
VYEQERMTKAEAGGRADRISEAGPWDRWDQPVTPDTGQPEEPPPSPRYPVEPRVPGRGIDMERRMMEMENEMRRRRRIPRNRVPPDRGPPPPIEPPER